MSDPFVKLWWVLALRGLAGLTLAVLAVAWPLFTLEALLFGFGLYAVADGAVALYAGLERREHGYPFWPFAVEGALGMLFGGAIIAFPDVMAFAGCVSVVFGALMVVWPRTAMITLAWLVGIYAALFGVLLLALAARLRRLGRIKEEGRRPSSLPTLTILTNRRSP